MRILIVKTSSLGDVVHMLPAVTDAATKISNLKVDWVVEESFQAVPSWHPNVETIFPVAIRRWRKKLFSKKTLHEICHTRKQIRKTHYDAVIDSQGLFKSSVITHWARGKRTGYKADSAREPLATWAYDQRFSISKNLHAIERNRQILAKSLNYSHNDLPLDYGIDELPDQNLDFVSSTNYIVALHGTSRPDKEWSEENWIELGEKLNKQSINLVFPWGNQREHDRANRIAGKINATVLPKLDLNNLTYVLKDAQAVVGMDTGLMHIAAALGKKGVGIFPVTKPELTGVLSADHSEQIMNLEGQVMAEEVLEVLR